MVKIPIKLIERSLKQYGAKRISKDAKKLVAKKLEKQLVLLTELAVKNARYFGRKLITKEDIIASFKQLKFLRDLNSH